MSALSDYATKQEILDLLYARARGADRFDPALMRACHPVDGTDNHGTYQGLMHGFIDALEKAMASGPVCLAKEHIIANALFDFLPNGDVFVESYHVAHETFVQGEGTVFFHIGGRYLDTFRRVEGRWLIQHRPQFAFEGGNIDQVHPRRAAVHHAARAVDRHQAARASARAPGRAA